MKITNEGNLGFGSLVAGLGGDPELPEGATPDDCCDPEPPVDRALDSDTVTVNAPATGGIVQFQPGSGFVSSGAVTEDFDDTPANGSTMYALLFGGDTRVIDTAGWTLLEKGTANGDQVALWTKVAGAAEPTSVHSPASGALVARLVLYEVAGSTDDSDDTDDQPRTSPLIGATLTASGTGVLIAAFIGAVATYAGDPTWTPQGDLVTDTFLRQSPGRLLSWAGHQDVESGSYTPSLTTTPLYSNPNWDNTASVAVIADATPTAVEWNVAAPNTVDGNDATYQEIEGPDVLRVDLGGPFRIVSCRLLIGCENAGTVTYTIRGANEADFSDAVTLGSVAFDSTGSFTADDIDITWSTDTAYQFFELSGPNETRRIYSFELYEPSAFLGQDHGHADIEAEIDDLAAAIDGLSGGALPWYDVTVDGTCVGDGVTDDTVALQAAIDDATTNGTQSATLYFPPGVYLIGGALQDTGAFNGQILLPDVSATDDQISIAFVGAARPPIEYVGNSFPSAAGYSIIKSTLTGASGTAACISGGDNGSGLAHLNNVRPVFRNLLFVAPDNPTFTMLNLGQCQGADLSGIQVAVVSAYSGTLTQPTHSNAYGVKMPQKFQSNVSLTDELSIGQFFTQILLGELDQHRGMVLGQGIVCMEAPDAAYPTVIETVSLTGFTYGLKGTGTHYVDIRAYVAEHSTSPAWRVTVYDVDDASNFLGGHIRWLNAATGGTIDHSFVKNGATGIWSEEMIKLAPNSGVTPGTYGDADNIPVLTVDVYGRVTAASETGFTPGASELDDLTDVTITGAVAGEELRWDGSAWVNDSGMICVDPGAIAVDSGTPFGVTLTSVWGIDAGTPYYDDANAAAGDEAALFYDPMTDNYVLVAYDF